MKGFKLTDLLGEQPPATATSGGEWDIQHIPLEQIIPAKNNNYRICDIEPLADSIHADGLEAPLVVRVMPDGGQYELISGERRYTAIKLLRDRGLAGYDTAPCKVKDNVSDLAAEIELIRANSTARVLTDQEKVTQAARLSELLGELKSGGIKVPGRKRDIIAGIMGVSSAQVGRMESVEKNLAPEAKAEFQQGNMNFSTAYETSLLPQEQQKKVVEDIQQGEKVDIKTVKQRRRPAATLPENVPTEEKQILDACCGGRMFWFDKENPLVLFCDKRELNETLCDGRKLEIMPDMLVDFTNMPFENEAFWHVVFDPPHLLDAGETSWLVKRYGKLPKNWERMIQDGFNECWRVLKTNGTLIFKWSEDSVTVGDVIKAIGKEPLYGQRSRRGNNTHWLCFVKTPQGG